MSTTQVKCLQFIKFITTYNSHQVSVREVVSRHNGGVKNGPSPLFSVLIDNRITRRRHVFCPPPVSSFCMCSGKKPSWWERVNISGPPTSQYHGVNYGYSSSLSSVLSFRGELKEILHLKNKDTSMIRSIYTRINYHWCNGYYIFLR